MNNPLNLTSGRLLARNTIINLLGEVAPFLVAVFAIPILVRGLGIDRYGVLTLSMMMVGYLGVFDLGLSSAATKLIAEAVAAGKGASVPGLFWTSLFLMLTFGVVVGLLIAVPAPWLVVNILKIPPAFRAESVHGFYVLALSIPFVISGSSLSGTLSAYQRFDLINLVRVPAGVYSYIGPLLVLPFSHSLAWIITVMVLGRAASWIVLLFLCIRVEPALRDELTPRRSTVRPMLTFGGWVTLSGVVGPVMDYLDRFIIGAILSIAAVAYYAVPSQLASKLRIIPAALAGVAFAAFSGAFALSPQRTALLFERSARYVIMAMFPPALLIVILAPEGITLWLGHEFAMNSVVVLRWLVAGMVINGVAFIPYALVQAAHRPDLTAKFHILEVPFYLVMLLWMLPRYGLKGAAIAWTVRAAADALALLVGVAVLLPAAVQAVLRVLTLTGLELAVLWFGALPKGLEWRLGFAVSALVVFVFAGWNRLLDSDERKFVASCLHAVRLFGV